MRELEKKESEAALAQAVRRFARYLRAHFGSEIDAGPRAFKRSVMRWVRSSLPPGRGRPCVETITRAAKMRAQGKDWRAIYVACIPTTVAGDSRQVAQSRLRSAVRARRRNSYRTLERE